MAELASLGSLPLRARCLADAVGPGRHRSRRRGASVEFADYRDYHAGDDLRRLDWRLLARTDRAHIRQSHDESPLRVLLLLDVSASMDYASDARLLSKLDYARALLGAVALIARRQRDACGVGLMGENLQDYLPAAQSAARWQSLWAKLESPPLARTASVARALDEALNVARGPTFFVAASDYYEEPAVLHPVLGRLRHEGHDLLALQVADPQEEDFLFSEAGHFEDAETGQRLALDPIAAAPAYRAAYAAHRAQLTEEFIASGFEHVRLRTDVPPLAGLGAYLARRAGRSR
ncbi:MAG TPA: DUF58 domain-containing protein [Opitutaceae bacterium]|jgi:uncharacterized protein (DUF58 family)|nr:DUF58 domain-containing protein [Opitutaceae bacterium]